MKRIIVFCLASFASMRATNGPLADVARTTVAAAVTAAGRGDTILLPTATATWSSTITLTKGISIIGTGMSNTVIKASGGIGSDHDNA